MKVSQVTRAFSLPSSWRPDRRFVLLTILLFVVLLLLTMPARVLLSFVDVTQFGVYAQGVSGPWYAGKSQRLRFQAREVAVDLTDLKWRVKPLALLRGRFMLALDGEFGQRPLQADVGVSVGGRVLAEHLRASVPLLELAPLMTQLTFPLAGQVDLQDISLELQQRWPAKLHGKVLLADVALTLPTQLLELGDVLVGLGQQDQDVLLSIIENNGQLGLSGQLTLAANRSFGLALSSEPREQLSPELRMQMQAILGNPDNGKFSFRYDGVW